LKEDRIVSHQQCKEALIKLGNTLDTTINQEMSRKIYNERQLQIQHRLQNQHQHRKQEQKKLIQEFELDQPHNQPPEHSNRHFEVQKTKFGERKGGKRHHSAPSPSSPTTTITTTTVAASNTNLSETEKDDERKQQPAQPTSASPQEPPTAAKLTNKKNGKVTVKQKNKWPTSQQSQTTNKKRKIQPTPIPKLNPNLKPKPVPSQTSTSANKNTKKQTSPLPVEFEKIQMLIKNGSISQLGDLKEQSRACVDCRLLAVPLAGFENLSRAERSKFKQECHDLIGRAHKLLVAEAKFTLCCETGRNTSVLVMILLAQQLTLLDYATCRDMISGILPINAKTEGFQIHMYGAACQYINLR